MTKTFDFLVRKKIVENFEIKAACNFLKYHDGRISSGLVLARLIEMGDIEGEVLQNAIINKYQCLVAELETVKVELVLLKLIPRETAESHLVFPLSLLDGRLKIAMTDPGDLVAVDNLRFLTRFTQIEKFFALPQAIRVAIEKHYPREEDNQAPYSGQVCSSCGRPLDDSD